MADDPMTLAVKDVARQVAASMRGLRANLDPSEVVYVIALVVPDDFASLMNCANTVRHLSKRPGRPIDKWHFAEWFATGMDLDMEVLLNSLGDPTYQSDPELRKLQINRQAAWLVALVEGLKLARSKGDLNWDGQPVIAYCSMIDSEESVWIEQETARLINPPEIFASFKDELAESSKEYELANAGPESLQAAFKKSDAETPMKKSLKKLLNTLDKIAEEFDEITDTEVREEMRVAVENGLLTQTSGYVLPDDFAMYDPKGNAKIKAALAKFIDSAKLEAETAGLKTRNERLRAFQDGDVVSDDGNPYDEYFGYDDSLEKA